MWSKPTWISDQHYLDWIFRVYENNNLFNIPIWSYVKVMSCGVYHLGFLIDTKTHTFCKGPSEEHSSYDFCQMFKKEKKKKKFSLWWLPSRIFFFNWNSIENPIKKNLISIEKPFVFNLNYICKTIVTKFKNHWLLLETPLNFHLFGKIC